MYSTSYSSSYSTNEKQLPNKHIVHVSKSYENNNGAIQSYHYTFDIDSLVKKYSI
jgi:hypothetical protein